ncbi:MAG TPA: tol-pal system protein YbgF [bacterium]
MVFSIISSFTSCATVWEVQKLRRDIKDANESVAALKENELKALGGETEKGLEDLRTNQADLLMNLEETKAKIMQLQGEIEELGHADEATKKELEAVKDILSSIQDDLKKAQEKPPDEESIYKQGLTAYNSKDYQKAKETFKSIIETFPNGKYIDNAHYWAGECYYSEGNYLAAIDEYGIVIEKYPSSPKRPAALLKAGMAFLELKRKKESKVFFQRVVNEYPKSEQAHMAKRKLAQLK